LTLELFPNKNISFESLFDGRLRKFGITVLSNDPSGGYRILVAPDGRKVPVGCDLDGAARFGAEMPISLMNAIAAEFEIDHRETEDAHYVLVQTHAQDSSAYMAEWFAALRRCDYPLKPAPYDHPAYSSLIERLNLDHHYAFDSAALHFIRGWQQDDQWSFVLNLRDPKWAELFTVMVGIGFFVRIGNRYQIQVPKPTIDDLSEAILRLAQTEDAKGNLHPERFLATMTMNQASSLRNRAKTMQKKLHEYCDEDPDLAESHREEILDSAQQCNDGGSKKPPRLRMSSDEIEVFLARKRLEGAKIDPKTAVVARRYTYVLDPYGVYELSDEEKCIGSTHFFCRPDSDTWVSEDDLPNEILDAIRVRKEN
jgi:hypothetical protein